MSGRFGDSHGTLKHNHTTLFASNSPSHIGPAACDVHSWTLLAQCQPWRHWEHQAYDLHDECWCWQCVLGQVIEGPCHQLIIVVYKMCKTLRFFWWFLVTFKMVWKSGICPWHPHDYSLVGAWPFFRCLTVTAIPAPSIFHDKATQNRFHFLSRRWERRHASHLGHKIPQAALSLCWEQMNTWKTVLYLSFTFLAKTHPHPLMPLGKLSSSTSDSNIRIWGAKGGPSWCCILNTYAYIIVYLQFSSALSMLRLTATFKHQGSGIPLPLAEGANCLTKTAERVAKATLTRT